MQNLLLLEKFLLEFDGDIYFTNMFIIWIK